MSKLDIISKVSFQYHDILAAVAAAALLAAADIDAAALKIECFLMLRGRRSARANEQCVCSGSMKGPDARRRRCTP